MEKRLVLRGFAAGAVGGLLCFIFARLFAEPVIHAELHPIQNLVKPVAPLGGDKQIDLAARVGVAQNELFLCLVKACASAPH